MLGGAHTHTYAGCAPAAPHHTLARQGERECKKRCSRKRAGFVRADTSCHLQRVRAAGKGSEHRVSAPQHAAVGKLCAEVQPRTPRWQGRRATAGRTRARAAHRRCIAHNGGPQPSAARVSVWVRWVHDALAPAALAVGAAAQAGGVCLDARRRDCVGAGGSAGAHVWRRARPSVWRSTLHSSAMAAERAAARSHPHRGAVCGAAEGDVPHTVGGAHSYEQAALAAPALVPEEQTVPLAAG